MTRSTSIRVWGWAMITLAALIAFGGAWETSMDFIILAYISFLHADVLEGKTR